MRDNVLLRTQQVIGTLERRRVHIEIELRGLDRAPSSDWELSICGFVSRRVGSMIEVGQCTDTVAEVASRGSVRAPWTVGRVSRLVAIWKLWHLNHMRAGCEHQRAAGWDKLPIYPDKPTNAYVEHPERSGRGWNMRVWLRYRTMRVYDAYQDAWRTVEQPYRLPDGTEVDGLLCKPCEVCGYRYGSSWLHEPLPERIVEWVRETAALVPRAQSLTTYEEGSYYAPVLAPQEVAA